MERNIFELMNEPLEYQISLHLNNLFATYGRGLVMIQFDYVTDPNTDYNFIHNELRPDGDRERMTCAVHQLVSYYGQSRMCTVLTELFGIKTDLNLHEIGA